MQQYLKVGTKAEFSAIFIFCKASLALY